MRFFAATPFASLVVPIALFGQQEQLTITTKNGTELEARGKEQLERIVQQYDVDRWLFTKDIVIESRVIPHSHPVLTLNTRYVRDDVSQLSTFLHEQFHWFEELRSVRRDSAMAMFREHFPTVPDRESGGARDAESTYLHLIVCDLEFQAMTQLLGEEKARELLAASTVYPWVYEQVLNNPVVREVNELYRFIAP